MAEARPIKFPVQAGGLKSSALASMAYPGAVTATNVRWTVYDSLAKRPGFTTYNTTQMGDVASAKEVVTGIFGFNRRDTTTRYTIVCTPTRILVCPTSGAWTALVSGMSLSGATDWWDAAVFNNELILCNGKESPRITDGTAGGTGTLSARAWQVRSVLGFTANATTGGMHDLEEAEASLHFVSSATAGSVQVPGTLVEYDVIADAAKLRTRPTTGKINESGFAAYGMKFLVGGATNSTPTLSATGEAYLPNEDRWEAITSATTAKQQAGGWGIGGFGYFVGGWNGAAPVTENLKYDPATGSWSAKTVMTAAKYRGAAFAATGNGSYCSGIDAAPNWVTTHYQYNSNTDAWLTATASTASTGTTPSGTGGVYDNTGYIQIDNAVYSYSIGSTAWTTETAPASGSATVTGFGSCGYSLYLLNNNTPASPVMHRFNTAPTAPIASYVAAHGGHVFLARSATFPSRVWYSAAGDARYWDPFAYFDVNPDDGDWITGIFSFDGRLYVTKTDTVYEITASVFDPGEGDIAITPLENVKGAVCNRSIVVTDGGVFYLAEDGFRWFNGSRSVVISADVDATIDGYVAARRDDVAGMWNRDKDEVWWSMTSTGSTHDRILVYNYRLKRWSVFSGIAAESIGIVEDANDLDQVLFGTADTTDGRIYKAETGTWDSPLAVETAISATYQTGWFSPASGLSQATPDKLYAWLKRSNLTTTLNGALTAAATTITVVSTSTFPTAGTVLIEDEQVSYTGKSATTLTGCTRGANSTVAAAHATATTVSAFTTLTVTSYDNYGSSARTTDNIILCYAGSASFGGYFEDTTDQRARLGLGGGTGHCTSIKLEDSGKTSGFELAGLIWTGTESIAGGGYPT